MINPSFQDLSKIAKSRYDVCVMVMKRARLIIDGSKPLVESKAKKPCTLALDEIMAGKVKTKSASIDDINKEKNEELLEEMVEEEKEGLVQEELQDKEEDE